MNQGVALVQAYLHVNGYFTVTEYPVMDVLGSGEPFAVTDLDVLAYRFAGAGHELVHGGAGRESVYRMPVDVALHPSSVIPDMIVGEVKEGRARLNPALRQPEVMAVALARFGCCGVEEASGLARELVLRGHAVSAAGHHVRTVAFGGRGQAGQQGPMLVIPMSHVVLFLEEYLSAAWPVLRHAQLSDPALALLALLKKSRVSMPETKAGHD